MNRRAGAWVAALCLAVGCADDGTRQQLRPSSATLPSVASLPTDVTVPADVSLPTDVSLPRSTSAAGQPGTVSLAIESPVVVDGWAPVPVVCVVEGRTYRASFASAPVAAGVSVSAQLTAVPYVRPGTYPGVGSAELVLPDGSTQSVPLAAPVTIADDLSGTIDVAVVTPDGVSVALSLAWFCSA